MPPYFDQDFMGEDLDATILAGGDAYDDEMGAAPVRRRLPAGGPNAMQRRGGAPQRAAAKMSELQSDGGNQVVEQFTPFTTGVFALATTALNLTALPQRRFQPQRLVVEVGRVGATAVSALVTLSNFFVGAQPQSTVIGGASPIGMFSPFAVGVRLFCNAARPGITLTAQLAQVGVASTDTINVACAAIGPVLD